jgi:hypothetical protein
MRYEYRNAAGRICCAGEGPEEFLCEDCRAGKTKRAYRAGSTSRNAIRKTDAEWAAHFGALLGVGSLVVEPNGPPDGYRAALEGLRPDREAALEALEGTHGEPYDPFGVPPDGYRSALRAMLRDTAWTGTPGSKPSSAPDGYAIALLRAGRTVVP